jgi:hypothetical protein
MVGIQRLLQVPGALRIDPRSPTRLAGVVVLAPAFSAQLLSIGKFLATFYGISGTCVSKSLLLSLQTGRYFSNQLCLTLLSSLRIPIVGVPSDIHIPPFIPIVPILQNGPYPDNRFYGWLWP